MKLKHFPDVAAVVGYIGSELVATLKDDANSLGRGDADTKRELRNKIADIEAVMPTLHPEPAAARDALRAILDVLNQDDDGDYFICKEAEQTIAHCRAVAEGAKGANFYALDDDEHATVLAALRYWQRHGMPCMGEHNLDVDELTTSEIDALCERLNDGYRWRVLQTAIDPEDGEMHELMRLVGRVGMDRTQRVLWARTSDCRPWERRGVRRIISETTERGRKVIFEYDERAGVVTLRLSRQRRGLTSTLGGLYWTLARQQATNTKRDRAFAKRTRRR
jgi:hypothetical protein